MVICKILQSVSAHKVGLV